MKVFIFITLLMIAPAQAAKITIHRDLPGGIVLYLYEGIEEGDVDQLQDLLIQYGHRARRVLFLNSLGGSVGAAMRLGFLVRSRGIATAIGKKGRCMSACSLVYFAGWDRYDDIPQRIKNPWGRLGLHHPYSDLGGQRHGSGPGVMKALERYFKFMQAGAGLFELMARTHYSKMAYVKNRTLSRVGGYQIRDTTDFKTIAGLLGPPEMVTFPTKPVPLPVKKPAPPRVGKYGVLIHPHVKPHVRPEFPDFLAVLLDRAGD